MDELRGSRNSKLPIFLRKLAGPAGLEPATSWFVVVMREINQRRPMTIKIRQVSNLQSIG
jgi:hypothetical protein